MPWLGALQYDESPSPTTRRYYWTQYKTQDQKTLVDFASSEKSSSTETSKVFVAEHKVPEKPNLPQPHHCTQGENRILAPKVGQEGHGPTVRTQVDDKIHNGPSLRRESDERTIYTTRCSTSAKSSEE